MKLMRYIYRVEVLFISADSGIERTVSVRLTDEGYRPIMDRDCQILVIIDA